MTITTQPLRVEKKVAKPTSVELLLPYSGVNIGYASTRLEIKNLTQDQAEALQRLTAALRRTNSRCQKGVARTADGIVVDTDADAIRFVLDQIADLYHSEDELLALEATKEDSKVNV